MFAERLGDTGLALVQQFDRLSHGGRDFRGYVRGRYFAAPLVCLFDDLFHKTCLKITALGNTVKSSLPQLYNQGLIYVSINSAFSLPRIYIRGFVV
jgi:hypothetical protein